MHRPVYIGLNCCSRCGGEDPNCYVCQTDTPEHDPDFVPMDEDDYFQPDDQPEHDNYYE